MGKENEIQAKMLLLGDNWTVDCLRSSAPGNPTMSLKCITIKL